MARLGQEEAQTLIVHNEGSGSLEIMVEVTPERYELQPGDKMEIAAQLDGAPFHINAYDGGLQIYAGNSSEQTVKINGAIAESWT